jgi:nicotinamidase-related amidase
LSSRRTALLVMDFQEEILASYPGDAIIPRVAKVLDAARKADMLVIFVIVGFRPGYAEVSASNKGFAAAKAAVRLLEPTVIDALRPLPHEPVLTKRRVSALGTTDLHTILRAQEVSHLVMTGISTSGVILSTTRMAADLDFEITILADCCADNDAEVHRVLLEKILPRQARVTDSATFLGELAVA